MSKVLKWVGGLLIIGLIGMFKTNHTLNGNNNTNQQISQSPTTQVTNTPAYINLDLKADGYTLKLVYAFANIEQCEKIIQSSSGSGLMRDFKNSCTLDCEILSNLSCSSFTDTKYISMLNQEYSGSQYLHISNKNDPNERGVIAFWGLSNQEAEQLCNYVKDNSKSVITQTKCLS